MQSSKYLKNIEYIIDEDTGLKCAVIDSSMVFVSLETSARNVLELAHKSLKKKLKSLKYKTKSGRDDSDFPVLKFVKTMKYKKLGLEILIKGWLYMDSQYVWLKDEKSLKGAFCPAYYIKYSIYSPYPALVNRIEKILEEKLKNKNQFKKYFEEIVWIEKEEDVKNVASKIVGDIVQNLQSIENIIEDTVNEYAKY